MPITPPQNANKIAAASRRANAESALRARLSGMTGDEPWILALLIQEAAHGTAAVAHRMLEVFERLGVNIPAGFKP